MNPRNENVTTQALETGVQIPDLTLNVPQTSPDAMAPANAAQFVPGAKAVSLDMSEILLLTDRYLPHAGGSRVYYHNLYSRMANEQDRVTVVTKRVPGAEAFDAIHSRGGLRIIRRHSPLTDLSARHLWKIASPLYEAVWRGALGRIDVLHSGDIFPPGAVALWMKRLAGIPYIAYCHGEDITLTEIRRLQRPLRNWIYQRADAVVAACEFARQKLLAAGIPEDKITKITPGVDAQRFRPEPVDNELARELGIVNKRVLLTIARLTARKGHATVLKALAQIRETVPDAAYVIAGTGPERANLEQLSRDLGIADRVHFAGYVAEERLCSYYNLCDVFVMMNQETDGDVEGFGMVFLEASAVGKPVIGGRSGGTADSVVEGKTGFLLDPLNVDALADKLTRLLLNENARRTLGEAGLLRSRLEFDWNSRAEMLRALSTDVVERKRRRPVNGKSHFEELPQSKAADDHSSTGAAV